MRVLGRSPALSLEEIEGWRAWSVVERDGVFVLSSLTRAEEWVPGEPFVATCSRRRHLVPGRRCSCGVYAAADRNELADLGRIAGAAIGQVSLWGQVAEHSRGYRAATAYPSLLRLVCVRCLADGRGEPAAVVAKDPSSGRLRLLPLCAAHADGRSLPPAGPVEAELLAAYGVEMVPDTSVRSIRGQERTSSRPHGRWLLAAALAAVVLFGASIYVHGRSTAPEQTSAGPAATAPAHRGHPQMLGPLARNGDSLQTIPNARMWFVRTPRHAPIRQSNTRRHPA
jgi:hypothetical protein